MKKILIVLFFTVSLFAKAQTHLGDKVIFHLGSDAAALNNGINNVLAFVVIEPNGSEETTVSILPDSGPLYSSLYTFPGIRKCTSKSDAETTGQCWSSFAQAKLWDVNVNTDLQAKDTLGNTNGKIMTEYASGQAISSAGYLTSEVDGSTTNEIELPSQTGNSGKILTTNGSSVSWATDAGSIIDKGSTTFSGITLTTQYTITHD